VLKGKRNWKKRFVVLSGSNISIYSSRNNKELKFSVDLSPGSHYISISEDVKGGNYFFSIFPVDSGSKEPIHMRVTSKQAQREWIDAIRSRLLDSNLRKMYKELTKKVSRNLALTFTKVPDPLAEKY
jgi:hypothetical protein